MTKRPNNVLAGLIMLLLSTLAPAALRPQQRDTALEGAWRFIAEVDNRADGSVIRTGPAAGYTGILIFTGSGYMSSTIMPKGRTWTRATVTPAQLRDTFEGGSAHAGRYEPDTRRHSFRLENNVTLDPGDEGKWDVVSYRVQRDTLEISGPWTYEGEKLTFTIRLHRMSDR